MTALSLSSRRFLSFCLGGGALAQVLAAIVFLFAANWWDMSPGHKAGVLGVLLFGAALGAMAAPFGSFARSAWGVAGMVLTGTLFAVHGQVWQTGADAWQLFAVWAVLALPWVLAVRRDGMWLVWSVIVIVAVILALEQRVPRHWVADRWLFTLATLVPVAVALIRYLALRLPGARPGGWLLPCLWVMTAILAGIGGIADLGGTQRVSLLTLAAAMVIAVLLRPALAGPWPFALALIVAVVMAEGLIATNMGDSASGILLVAVLMLAGLGGLSWALKRFVLPHVIKGERGAQQVVLDRLISCAVGLGAWIAAPLAMGALVALLMNAIRDLSTQALLSAAIVAGLASGAVALTRAPLHSFRDHMRGAFAVMAYGGLVGAVLVRGDFHLGEGALAAAILVPILVLTTPNGAAGALTAMAAMGFGLVYLSESAAPMHAPWIFAAMSAVMTGLGWLAVGFARPSARWAGLSLLLGVFVMAAGWEMISPEWALPTRVTALVAAACMMIAAVLRDPEIRDRRVMAAGAVTLLGSLLVPTGAAGLVGLAGASTRILGRPLILLGFAAAGWSLIRYYYLLDVALDRKALFLLGGAAFTSFAALLVGGLQRHGGTRQWASVLPLVFCALLPIAAERVAAWQKAEIVAEGRPIYLPLRPTDPRSLLQGDYMVLAYPEYLTTTQPGEGGKVVLRLDANDVAMASRPLDQPPAADEIAVQAHGGRDGWPVAPASFLFPEGAAASFQRARYAEVRVFDGALVLVGLADQEQRHLDAKVEHLRR